MILAKPSRLWRPSARAVFVAALGAPVAVLVALVMPRAWGLAMGWLVAIPALMLVDAALAAASGEARLDLESPGALGVGRSARAGIAAVFPGRPPARVGFALGGDDHISAAPFSRVGRTTDGVAGAEFELTALRRGSGRIAQLWTRWSGPLGLVWRQEVRQADRKILVTPDIAGVSEEAARLFSRDAPVGVKSQLDSGDGAEFHALREFTTGMDKRTVDWKSSARHGKLLSKEFRVERNHPIVVALDCGRTMCEPLAGLPRIDRAINAGLLLGYVSLKLGDRVGLYAFDSKPRLIAKTVSGVGAFPLLQRMAAEVDYSAEESNHVLALSQLSASLQRRSLVVIFTEFADATAAELMLETVGRLIKRHVVLYVAFRDEELETMARAEPAGVDDVLRAATAAALLRERGAVISRLRRLGVQVVDAAYDRVGPALLNAYMDIKKRDLL